MTANYFTAHVLPSFIFCEAPSKLCASIEELNRYEGQLYARSLRKPARVYKRVVYSSISVYFLCQALKFASTGSMTDFIGNIKTQKSWIRVFGDIFCQENAKFEHHVSKPTPLLFIVEYSFDLLTSGICDAHLCTKICLKKKKYNQWHKMISEIFLKHATHNMLHYQVRLCRCTQNAIESWGANCL